MAVESWSQNSFCGSTLPGTRTLETVAALPSTVTVKAEAGGGLDNCRSSENTRLIISASVISTSALVSVGGVVSAATWKIAESPYMGRVTVLDTSSAVLLLRGPWLAAAEELGRPTITSISARALDLLNRSKYSVPRSLQPVRG